MIPEFVQKWEENKSRLEDYFTKTEQNHSYMSIVKKLFELVINNDEESFAVNNLHIIDDGDYQGSLIFLIPESTYQPSPREYVFTTVSYGSCSGCDTLKAICDYKDGLPTRDQVKDYMTLALHLLQNCKWLVQ